MGFHIQRLGDNPFDEILMQRCVGLNISRCPTTMTNSKSPLMQRTTSEISCEKKNVSVDRFLFSPEELDVKVEGSTIVITAKQEVR